ncbi:MAG: UPF0104 family protein [Candidatus Electrothrix sp. AS4_5]|nr:UPF0104 family protein [Candidatus Electrothrix gigas]
MKTSSFINQYKKLFQLSFGIILLGVVILSYDPSTFYQLFITAPFYYLIPCFLIYYFLMALIWAAGVYLLLRRIKKGTIKKIITSSFKLQLIAVITPGRLGDIGLLYYLKKMYTSGQLSAIFFIDKLITLGVNVALSIIGIGIFLSWKYAITISFLLLAIFFSIIWFLFKFPQKFIQWVFLKKIIIYLQGFRTELHATTRDIKGVAGNLLLTIIRYILSGICALLALLWFGEQVALSDIILIQAVAQLATFIPLTTMGLGITEAVSVSLFSKIGITSEIVLAALLWSRAVYLMFIAGIYLCWIGIPLFSKIINRSNYK